MFLLISNGKYPFNEKNKSYNRYLKNRNEFKNCSKELFGSNLEND